MSSPGRNDSSTGGLRGLFWRCVFVLFSTQSLQIVLGIAIILLAVFLLMGCSAMPEKPIVQTVTIEKPVQVPCRVPPIERPAWETERANAADPVLVSRAIRAELEQRRGYETRLEAAAKSCE